MFSHTLTKLYLKSLAASLAEPLFVPRVVYVKKGAVLPASTQQLFKLVTICESTHIQSAITCPESTEGGLPFVEKIGQTSLV